MLHRFKTIMNECHNLFRYNLLHMSYKLSFGCIMIYLKIRVYQESSLYFSEKFLVSFWIGSCKFK